MSLFETVAYAEAVTSDAAAGTAAMISTVVPFVIVFLFMYVAMIRPQRKKEKELRQKISEMKVGDKVTTIGGIKGKVSKIKDDFVIIESGNVGTPDEKSFIKFEKSAIKDIETKVAN